jgi:hypothetical protein
MSDTPKKTLTIKRKPTITATPASATSAPPPATPTPASTPTNAGNPDAPKKTLTLKRTVTPPATPATPAATPTPTLQRGAKRIIRREELTGVQKAGTIKPKQPKQKKPKPNRKRQPPKPKKTPPSELRAKELNDSLNNFMVWLHYQPLALGIEKQIFKHVNDLQLSASKRVVQKLLHYHTHNTRYLQNVGAGGVRYNLDGTESGVIVQLEREHAGRILAAKQAV